MTPVEARTWALALRFMSLQLRLQLRDQRLWPSDQELLEFTMDAARVEGQLRVRGEGG